MQNQSWLKSMGRQVEHRLAGALPESVRRNMYVELWVSIAYGAFFAASVVIRMRVKRKKPLFRNAASGIERK